MATWVEHLDINSGQNYYVNTASGESTWNKPPVAQPAPIVPPRRKKKPVSSGLSALSKQLRELQTQNTLQSNEIERLTRQIKLTTELKGTSVLAVKEALRTACEGEAHDELLREISALKSKLKANTEQQQQQQQRQRQRQQTGAQFTQESTERTIATLELRVGELEELEDTLRNESTDIYTRLGEQTSKAVGLESLVSSLRVDLHSSRQAVVMAQEAAAAAVAAATAQSSAETNQDGRLLLQQQRDQEQQEQHNKETRLNRRISDLEEQVSVFKGSDSKIKLLEEQIQQRQQNTDLIKAQHEARFTVQDERIQDLTGQLSSLYVAFELLQQEHAAENERMAALQSNLHASDSQVAMQLHKEMKEEEENERNLGSPPPPPPPPSTATNLSSSSSSSLLNFAMLSSPPASAIKADLAGYLFKRPLSNGKKRSGWKKRWFELKQNHGGIWQLTYRDTPKSKVKGTVGPINSLSQVSPVHDFPKQPHAFVVHLILDDVVLYAAAATQVEQEQWLAALKNCAVRDGEDDDGGGGGGGGGGSGGRNGRESGGRARRHTVSPLHLMQQSMELKQTDDAKQKQEAADHAMALRMAQEFQ